MNHHHDTHTDAQEVAALKQQMADMVEDWDPSEETRSFSTNVEANQKQGSDDYFLESASRVHFFAEPTALDQDNRLLPQYTKLAALNKAGHGLHRVVPGAFYDYTVSSKVRRLVRDLGWHDPVVPQSMYICKNARIGGTVHSHQDSTFLYTTPRQSCLGLWLALDDATLQNGCLWIRPQSHHEPVRRQFRRNPQHFTTRVIEERSNVGLGDTDAPKMVFDENNNNGAAVEWEGALPKGSEPPCQGLLDAGFIPVECRAGDLLAFNGTLDHLSLPNLSDRQRHTFQLHMVEGPRAGVEWSKYNWLQYPSHLNFLRLNDHDDDEP